MRTMHTKIQRRPKENSTKNTTRTMSLQNITKKLENKTWTLMISICFDKNEKKQLLTTIEEFVQVAKRLSANDTELLLDLTTRKIAKEENIKMED